MTRISSGSVGRLATFWHGLTLLRPHAGFVSSPPVHWRHDFPDAPPPLRLANRARHGGQFRTRRRVRQAAGVTRERPRAGGSPRGQARGAGRRPSWPVRRDGDDDRRRSRGTWRRVRPHVRDRTQGRARDESYQQRGVRHERRLPRRGPRAGSRRDRPQRGGARRPHAGAHRAAARRRRLPRERRERRGLPADARLRGLRSHEGVCAQLHRGTLGRVGRHGPPRGRALPRPDLNGVLRRRR